jgi:hypothetical protein
MAQSHTDLAYDYIDSFLNKLNEKGGDTPMNMASPHTTAYKIAFEFLFDYDLVSSRRGFKDPQGIVDITPKGINVLKSGGFKCLMDKLEQESLEELRIKQIQAKNDEANLELTTKTLEDFPRTKRRATIAFWIAIALAIIEIVKLFID